MLNVTSMVGRTPPHLFGGSPMISGGFFWTKELWDQSVIFPTNAQKSGRSKFHVKTTVFHIGSAWACLKIGTKFLWFWFRNAFFHIFPIQIAIHRGKKPSAPSVTKESRYTGPTAANMAAYQTWVRWEVQRTSAAPDTDVACWHSGQNLWGFWSHVGSQSHHGLFQ